MDASEDALARLPIFPLQNVVLLPRGLLPLHIFEPRYRSMIQDALAGHGLIGMATPLASEQMGSPPPPVADMVGVGRIIGHEEMDDGRFLIVLRGVGRARVRSELPSETAYRIVHASAAPDRAVGDPDRLRESTLALRTLADSVANSLREGSALIRQALASETTPGGLSDLVGATLIENVAAQQTLLATTDVQSRVDFLNTCVAELATRLIPSDHLN